MLRKPLLNLSVAAALLLTSGIALAAGSAFVDFTVSASVSANCTISATNLVFGTYDPVAANASTAKTGTGTVTVACTKGATGLTIGMSDGGNFSGTRRMAGGSPAGFLTYDLYQPTGGPPGTCPGSTLWTSAAPLSLADAPSKADRIYNVCGTIPANQDVAVGAYSDTVRATINF